MTGRELIKWILDNHAEDLPILNHNDREDVCPEIEIVMIQHYPQKIVEI